MASMETPVNYNGWDEFRCSRARFSCPGLTRSPRVGSQVSQEPKTGRSDRLKIEISVRESTESAGCNGAEWDSSSRAALFMRLGSARLIGG